MAVRKLRQTLQDKLKSVGAKACARVRNLGIDFGCGVNRARGVIKDRLKRARARAPLRAESGGLVPARSGTLTTRLPDRRSARGRNKY